MKLYSRKLKRNVERQIHFGVGNSVKTACGLVFSSRHVPVSVFSSGDGAIITSELKQITCKRCLASSRQRLLKMIALAETDPGIFDRHTLYGEKWLLKHSLDILPEQFNAQTLAFRGMVISPELKIKDMRYLLKTKGKEND